MPLSLRWPEPRGRRATGRLRQLALLAALLAGSCGSPPQDQKLVFLSDERGDAVVAVDPSTGAVRKRIAVGKRPRGIAFSADGRTLYVALSGSAPAGPGVDESKLPPPDRGADGIAVVDPASGNVRHVLKAGTDPETFALSPDGTMLYVANEDTARVSMIDRRGGGIKRQLEVGEEPEGIAVTRDGSLVYVACEASDRIDVIDARKMLLIRSIPIAGRPRTLLASSDGRFIFASIEIAGKLAILSARDGSIEKLVDLARGDPRIRPMGLAQAPNGRLFVTTGRGGGIAEIDVESGRLVRTINGVGERPWGIAVAPDGRRLITANGPSGTISIIDIEKGAILAAPKIGVGPWGVAAAP